ncbi:MAG: P-loop NTPase, partial [Deltaproteobacteria bacterium]|nr:P-loop NTPase [Deltaproteobacteria bacterium]
MGSPEPRQHPDPEPSSQGGPGAGRSRRTIAVGGGSRGVGKTLLSVNLAVYLAQLGRSVVICDADPQGSNLHTMLGLDAGPLALPETIAATAPVETTVPGLRLMPTGYDAWTMAPKHVTRLAQWLAPLERLDVDYAVLNLGASISGPSLDAFCEADVGICAAAPEPAAIEAAYRFCRALFARRLRRALMCERFKLRVVERALAALPPLPTPLALVAQIGRFDEAVAAAAALTLRQLGPGLVVGKTRLRRDLELGPAMCSLS